MAGSKKPGTNVGKQGGIYQCAVRTTPSVAYHNPDPAYLRGLLARAGLTQAEAAARLGISARLMRMYLAPREVKTHQPCPYAVQYCLERLADAGSST